MAEMVIKYIYIEVCKSKRLNEGETEKQTNKQNSQWYIVIQLLKNINKVLKVVREKGWIAYRGIKIRVRAGFLSNALHWSDNDIFKCWNKQK